MRTCIECQYVKQVYVTVFLSPFNDTLTRRFICKKVAVQRTDPITGYLKDYPEKV
jgi:hypothetical protein